MSRTRLSSLIALALALSVNGSVAQETRATLQNYANQNITANGRGLITGLIVNNLHWEASR